MVPRTPTARFHPKTATSTDSAVHSKTRKHAHSEVPLTTGRAPSRIVLQSPCACPLHPPPNRFVLPPQPKHSSLLQHTHQLLQYFRVESASHFDSSTPR